MYRPPGTDDYARRQRTRVMLARQSIERQLHAVVPEAHSLTEAIESLSEAEYDQLMANAMSEVVFSEVLGDDLEAAGLGPKLDAPEPRLN